MKHNTHLPKAVPLTPKPATLHKGLFACNAFKKRAPAPLSNFTLWLDKHFPEYQGRVVLEIFPEPTCLRHTLQATVFATTPPTHKDEVGVFKLSKGAVEPFTEVEVKRVIKKAIRLLEEAISS